MLHNNNNKIIRRSAFTLARWFGLTKSEARDVLPSSVNFDYRALYLMFNGLGICGLR